jgi:GDP-4-dehydro-6-deoxy-D-mannose reductase
MRVLVTGAGGFVGGYLVRELLAAGREVFAGVFSADGAACPEGATPVPLDLTSTEGVAEAVEAARPEAVFHLAAQSSVGASFDDPLGTWEVNATGTLRLARALPRGTRLLFVSSAEVYGAVPEDEQPIRESRPPRPATPYAVSKAAAELAVLQAGAAGALHAVVTRSFNHTGPGQDPRFSLPSFARQLGAIAAGAASPVLRVGNLSARRDFLDVRDVVRAYPLLLERGEAGGVYNVCSGTARPLRELVERMVALSGTGARIEVDPERVRPVDAPLLLGDAGRLHALGWSPRIPIDETLAALLARETERAGGHAEAVR